MTWLEIAALCFLFLGIAAGGYLVATRPTFWLGLGTVLLTKAWPYISAYVTRAEFNAFLTALQDLAKEHVK